MNEGRKGWEDSNYPPSSFNLIFEIHPSKCVLESSSSTLWKLAIALVFAPPRSAFVVAKITLARDIEWREERGGPGERIGLAFFVPPEGAIQDSRPCHNLFPTDLSSKNFGML